MAMIKLLTVALGLVSLSHVIISAAADEATCNGCQNGGVLTQKSDGSGVVCQCPDKYTGDFCEKVKCDTCKNGGVLTKKSDGTGIYCQCPDKYTGNLCETLRECPAGFEYASTAGKCYKVVNEKKNYVDARKACPTHAAGAQLVVVENKEQNDAVQAYLKARDADSKSKGCTSQFYTGGQREPITECRDKLDNFVWKHNDGTSTPLTYRNWKSGEPNCGSGTQGCLFIWDLLYWDDNYCQNLECFVCETKY